MGWDHGAYSAEAYEKASQALRKRTGLSVSDLEPLTDREKLLVETAYRRGYYQGHYLALEMVHSIGIAKAYNFVVTKLKKWRLAKHDGKLIPPPLSHDRDGIELWREFQ